MKKAASWVCNSNNHARAFPLRSPGTFGTGKVLRGVLHFASDRILKDTLESRFQQNC